MTIKVISPAKSPIRRDSQGPCLTMLDCAPEPQGTGIKR
jgi:hypothetical protein